MCRLLSNLMVLFLILHQLLILSCNTHAQATSYDPPHKKFEYKWSFKGPYLAQKDGQVPFWEYGGSAIASEEMIRITPSLKSKKGQAWTKYKTNFEWWEVELWLRVTGRGRLGADGIAFWFTDSKYPEGPVFGSADQWRGLGIFFDSFDNDAKGNNPFIMAMMNDGNKIYDHDSDGSAQQIGGCLRDFRNKPFPVRAKIEYYRNILSVFIQSGNTNNDNDYELCLRAENVFLPQFGHFGLSAATGALADDHDAIRCLVSSLHVPGSLPVNTQTVPDAEKQKIDSQYEQFKDQLEKKKEQYFKDHPEEAKKYHEEEGDNGHEYESLGEKELQQIFDVQSQIHLALNTLNRKLDEILGRQERTLSLIGSSVQPIPGQPGGQVPAVAGLPIQRHEVETLLGSQREVLQTSRDLRQAFVNHQALPASAQAGAASNSLHSQLLTEIRDSVNVLRQQVTTVETKFTSGSASAQVGCPPVPNCATASMVIAMLGCHLVITIGYFIYKASSEKKHGKFY